MHAYRADRQENRHDPAVRRRRQPCAGHRAAGREVRGRGRADHGEGRLQRRAARRRHAQGQERRASRCAAISPRRRSSPRPGSASSGSPTRRCSRWAREIHVGHFVAGQFVDVAGVSDRQGLRRCDEAAQFRRPARPRTACRSRTAATARPATARIRAACSRTRRWPATWAIERVTVQNLEVFGVDPDRGLILVKGGVPGPKGGYVRVTDAVKSALPKQAPFPAAVGAQGRGAAKPSSSKRAGRR